MNRRDKDVLLALSTCKYSNQRDLASLCGCSLGGINGSLKNLHKKDLIDSGMGITQKGYDLLKQSSPQRAILLAAGFGIKLSLFSAEKPKALLDVQGEVLIERLIRQLYQVGVNEIHIVVGFAKERFEYLIDKFGVDLIVNSQYALKNNLHSVALAEKYLENAYVVPCDLWCRENPFNKNELYSWYMVSNAKNDEDSVRVNRKQELVVTNTDANDMLGIAYLNSDDAKIVRDRIAIMNSDRRYKGSFWEETLYEKDRLLLGAKVVDSNDVIEINSIYDLQELDAPRMIPLDEVSEVFQVKKDEITDISILKKGMTNRSFLFTCKGERYILRLPQKKESFDYNQEFSAYKTVENKDVADDVVYFNCETGLKISKYMCDVHFCNAYDPKDVNKCISKLRDFHQMKLSVDYKFDLFLQIEYYESLWNGEKSVYPDYEETKKKIFSLREFIDSQEKEMCLCHIDAVQDNFMMPNNSKNWRDIRLIDWEYAGMQDPHLDLAMFSLHAMYDKKHVDALVDEYFENNCSEEIRHKIYAYIAVGGLLWSNWCEYKLKNGAEFGEYSIRQYRFAKEYYEILKEKGIV